MQERKDERSLGELFADLARDMGVLVRQEMHLATTEVTQKVTRAGKHLGLLVAGGVIAYAGFLALLATIIIGLGQLGLPWWIAALIVGVVVTGAGAILIQQARTALMRTDFVPRQTVDTLKEDVEWAKTQTQ
jgi:TRAP-type C4-dicarboxylate transport system permease small subunit